MSGQQPKSIPPISQPKVGEHDPGIQRSTPSTPTNEVRLVVTFCIASIGVVGAPIARFPLDLVLHAANIAVQKSFDHKADRCRARTSHNARFLGSLWGEATSDKTENV